MVALIWLICLPITIFLHLVEVAVNSNKLDAYDLLIVLTWCLFLGPIATVIAFSLLIVDTWTYFRKVQNETSK